VKHRETQLTGRVASSSRRCFSIDGFASSYSAFVWLASLFAIVRLSSDDGQQSDTLVPG
jgi:hypothetical protein